MTTPDWSKAPDGATHWGPDTAEFSEFWYKIYDDGLWPAYNVAVECAED